MKTKLIELAKKVGFGAVLMQNVAYKAYPDLEPMRYYLWMCELQKWCREKHNFLIGINYLRDDLDWFYQIWLFPLNMGDTVLDICEGYNNYEQALEEGLYQTLLLIQEGNGKEN